MSFDTRVRTPPKRITFFDVLVISLLGVLSLAPLIIRVSGAGERPHTAEIVTGTGPAYSLSLDHGGQHIVSGPLGETIIEIAPGQVRIKASDCPRKICVREGWKDTTGQIILCAPNRVGVFLKGEGGDVDAVSR